MLQQFTSRRKIRRIRELANIRDTRIRKAQTVKQELWTHTKLIREERLQVKNKRLEFRLRGQEIAEVAQSWVLLSMLLSAGLWEKARFDVKMVRGM